MKKSTSATSLAAIVAFSQHTAGVETVLYTGRALDFYRPWERNTSHVTEPWIEGQVPLQLFVVADRGRFEFRIPDLFPLLKSPVPSLEKWIFRNIFKRKNDGFYLKGQIYFAH